MADRNVPFFNYQEAFATHEEAFVEIFRDVLRRGAFIMQSDLADFERSLAEYLGIRYVIGVGNGTDALEMILRLSGIGPGDEVIFPSHTMIASPGAIVAVGANPIPIDCGPDHLLDPGEIEPAITPNTKAIMPVHLNGRTCKMDRIQETAAKYGLLVVEDSAQALGSKYRGRFAGAFGVAGMLSFYPAKNLGCMGDGGAILTDDPGLAEECLSVRDHGRGQTTGADRWGRNSRLDNLQAAILSWQFRHYQDTISRRRAIARMYDERLRDLEGLVLPPAPDSDPDHFDVFQNYEIEADRRDGLKGYLSKRGVGTLIQWGGKAVHQFTNLGFDVSLPNTERLFERCLMLPLNMNLTEEDVDFVAAHVSGFYGQ